MNLPTNPWAYWILGCIIGSASIATLLWALFCDRAKGRPRCRACGYDMSGTGALQCSECGRCAKHPKDLLKVRRHYRVACLGAVGVVLGGASFAMPQIRKDGWLSIVPTTALLIACPPAGEESDFNPATLKWIEHPVSVELRRRDAARCLAGWQWKWVIENKGVLASRAKWPKDEPLAVRMKTPQWAGNAMEGQFARERYQEIGRLDERTSSLAFDCTVTVVDGSWKAGSWLSKENRVEVWSCVVKLPVEIAPTIDDVLAPVDNATVADHLADGLDLMLKFNQSRPNGQAQPVLGISLDRSKPHSLEGMAFSVMVEMMRDGEVVADASFPLTEPFWGWHGQAKLHGAAWLVRPRPDEVTAGELDRWTVRIHGTSSGVLAEWDCQTYWAGEMTVPLKDALAGDGSVLASK